MHLQFSAKFSEYFTPVSYTHLDVYKRQDVYSTSMSFIASKKLKLMKLLQEKEDDDTLLMLASFIHKRKRRATKEVFKRREEEGCFKILIERHLKRDEELFRQYCRLNYDQFDMVLSLVAEDLKPSTTRQCISAQQKLFLTLR